MRFAKGAIVELKPGCRCGGVQFKVLGEAGQAESNDDAPVYAWVCLRCFRLSKAAIL